MDMIDIHRAARKTVKSIYHEFMGKYKNNNCFIYGFVEGKNDLNYYTGAIVNSLPVHWNTEIWVTTGKEQLINLYYIFNWERFPKYRILFFIDRDLDAFITNNTPVDQNIYITDQYSIENDITSGNRCDRVLTELFSLSEISKEKKEKIVTLYLSQLEVFKEHLCIIMAWAIYWYRNGHKPVLSLVEMKDLCSINQGKVTIINRPLGCETVTEYIHTKWAIPLSLDIDISETLSEFIEHQGFHKYIRGKYLLWFFVEFVNSAYTSLMEILPDLSKLPKIHITLGHHNAMEHIAPRARIPQTLIDFLQTNFLEIKQVE